MILLHKLIFHQFDNTIIKLFKIVPSTIELLKQILYFRNIYSNNNLPQIKFKLAYLSTESFKWTSKAILLNNPGKMSIKSRQTLILPREIIKYTLFSDPLLRTTWAKKWNFPRKYNYVSYDSCLSITFSNN